MKLRIYFALVICAVVALVAVNAGVVPQGHANDRALTVPEAWRGTWEVTVAYRDRETGALVATDVTTAGNTATVTRSFP